MTAETPVIATVLGGLENRRPARVRGFESHPLRSVTAWVFGPRLGSPALQPGHALLGVRAIARGSTVHKCSTPRCLTCLRSTPPSENGACACWWSNAAKLSTPGAPFPTSTDSVVGNASPSTSTQSRPLSSPPSSAARSGVPVARLVAWQAPDQPVAAPGAMRGRIQLAEDFDAPLNELFEALR